MEEKVLTKEDILGMEDLQRERIYIPEWKGTVIVRGLTTAERDDFESQIFTGEGKNRKFNAKDLRSKLLSFSICNEAGERIFSDSDVEKLGKRSARATDKLFAKAQELSGIGEKDVEELLKNSKPDQPA
jgi:hypothetical protein